MASPRVDERPRQRRLAAQELANALKSDYRAKLDVDWCRRADERVEFEPTVGQLVAEHRNVVGVLVCVVKKGSRRIDVHDSGPGCVSFRAC